MPREIVWHREWTAPTVAACCLDCSWQWEDRGGKTTIGLRVSNAAEKHAECLGHRVLTQRTRLVFPTKRIRAGMLTLSVHADASENINRKG